MDMSDFYYRPLIRLTREEYNEACFPAGYECILLPCKHIGCEDAVHGGGVDDNDSSRLPEEWAVCHAAYERRIARYEVRARD